MATIELRYAVVFGRGDGSDLMEYEYDVTQELATAYELAIKMRKSTDSVPGLDVVLRAAYREIEEFEIGMLCDVNDSYVLECQGRVPMDADELNDLVHDGDPYALEYFNLQDLSAEELEDWDAHCDLDELPLVCDFVEGFEPESPFDGGYSLHVKAIDSDDYEWLEEEEAEETIRYLFELTPGDFSLVLEYIEINGEDYGEEELRDLAIQVAEELGIADFETE